jgi:SAM-dependent methyltransferase/glycosyltransferase involved in cell wall biosynthesis
MTSRLDFTGERYVPERGGEIRLEHVHRYAFCRPHVKGKVVLDVACGEGYGSSMLAADAAQVIGVDVSEQAVAHARDRYSHLPNVEFKVGDATRLDVPAAYVDVVVSFETIEHLGAHDEMLAEITRVLKPRGLLILSSPDKRTYSDEPGYQNEFHVKELYRDELTALLGRHFKHHELLGQRISGGSSIFSMSRDARARKPVILVDDGQAIEERQPVLADPIYFIAIATNGPALPQAQPSTALSETDDPVLGLKKMARWASGLHQEVMNAQAAHAEFRKSAEEEIDRLRGEARAATQAKAEQEELRQGELRRVRDELVAHWSQRCRQLEAAREEFSDQSAFLRQQLEGSRAEAEATESALRTALQVQESSLEETAARHKQAVLQLEEAVARLTAELELSTEDAQAARREALLQRADLEQLAQRNRDVQARCLSLERDLVDAKAEAARQAHDMQGRCMSLERDLVEARAEAARQAQLAMGNESRAADAEAQVRLLGAESGALQLELTEQRRQVLGLQEQLVAERQEAQGRERIDAARIESATERITELRATLEAMQRDHDSTLAEMTAAQASAEGRLLAQYRAETQELSTRIRLVEDAARDSRQQHAAEIERLKADSHLASQEHQTRVAALEEDAAAELAWWRQEVTEARRQLQHLRLGQQRQAEAAARGLRQLQQQHADERHALQSALAAGMQRLHLLGRGLGGQLEALRLAAGSRQQLAGEAIASLQNLQEQAREATRALDQVRPALGLPAPETPTATLPDLMALDDAGFVHAAYRGVLLREPDPSGQDHYLQRLRGGELRLRVLSDLRVSEEGRSKTPAIEGLDAALAALRRRRLPWSARSERRRLQQVLALGSASAALQPRAEPASDARQLRSLERSVESLGRESAMLAEAVPIAVSLGRAPREFGLDPWACAQELVRADDDAFVALAYGLIRRRPPEASELQRERQQLASGSSRVHVIDLMLQNASGDSPEAGAAAYRSRALLALGAANPFPVHESPEVSIVIAAHGRLGHTLRCLQSIGRHPPAQPFEVIVVDDASADASADVLAQVAGLRLERRDAPGGVGACFNTGAAIARGEWLHFLRGDAEVHPDWLDELHRTFRIFPGTGAAGSKLLQVGGKVLSAGRVMWQDGSATDLGTHGDPDTPELSHAREVDACATASLLVPRSLFEAVGGFPAEQDLKGAEDRALALRLADRGYRTIFQPLSVVTCHLPIDAAPPVPDAAAQLRSQHTRLLLQHLPPGSPLEQAAHRRQGGRLLAIEHRLPRPDRDAGSVSVFNMLMAARELGLHVSLIAEADLSDGVAHDLQHVRLLQRSGVQVLMAPHVQSVAEHLRAAGPALDAVLLYRPVVMERYAELVQRLAPKARRLYYPHDLHFLRLSRQARATGDAQLAVEADARRAGELALHRQADHCLLASQTEVQILAEAGLADNASWLPLLLDCTRTLNPAAGRQDLLFVGGFHHAPNIHALRLLLEEIMPRLRQLRPELRLWVVGEAPPPDLVARQDPGVSYLGAVQDLTPLMDRVRVAVAPLKFGAGAKGKVARPMAAGVPVVATSEAIEGMELTAGEHLLLADNADAFAQEVLRLHDDDALWQRLADAGHQQAVRQWGPRAACTNLARVLQKLGVDTRQSPYGCKFFHEPSFLPEPREHTPPAPRSAAIAAS